MGGSLGVALFGAIFASRLASELTALPAAVAARLSGGVNISPDEVHALPPEIRHEFLLAFVDALQPVFLVGAGAHGRRLRADLAAQGGAAPRGRPLALSRVRSTSACAASSGAGAAGRLARWTGCGGG